MICTRCGFANGAGARFCGGCGQPLQATRTDAAERRRLVVMFVDLVGSTALSQQLDPEDLRDLIRAYQQICADAVRRHDGHVAQLLGDGVMTYFGYPQSHEDDVQRAVRCALDILEATGELAATTQRRLGVPVQVRIGAHSGRVVIGGGASEGDGALALGDTPNIAARLQSVAAPGSLVVSDTLWKLAGGYFVGHDLGERVLAGIAEPMRMWQVTGRSGAESRLEAAGTATPYVGRERERAQLRAAWSDAVAGRAHFATLIGEPGLGKSRLLDIFRRELTDAEILEARCTPYGQNAAYLPLVRLLERRLDVDRTRPADERLDRLDAALTALGFSPAEAVPLLSLVLSLPSSDRYPEPDVSPVRRRTLTLELLVRLVHAMAQQHPVLLVVEDLHWADASTVEFLQMLVASAPALPLLGVFTARPEFAAPWPASDGSSVIDLARLADAEVERIVRAVAGGKRLPDEVSREILKRCDGVPLFVEEVTRTVLESGALHERETLWELSGPLPTELIPASVEASLMTRIDRLGPARATAQLAATIGRDFSYPLLRAVSERSDDELAEDLRRLAAAGLATADDGEGRGGFQFHHALVRDAAYESLLRSTRQTYHGRIAEALLASFPDVVAEQPELIAHHLSGARQNERAVDYWAAAGRRALTRTAMTEAAAHLRRAIECVGRLPADDAWRERELDLQNELAPVLMTVQGWGAADVRIACERARELATALGRPDKLYPALWGLWTYYFLRGEMDEALSTAELVWSMAEATGVPLLRVTGVHALAYSHLYRGEFEAAVRRADEGLALYDLEQERAIANTFQLSSSVALRTSRATALWFLGELDEAEAEADRLVQLGKELGHLPSRAAAMAFELHIGLPRFWHGRDVRHQQQLATELRELSRQEGYILWYAVAVVYLGAATAIHGDAAQAVSIMRDGLAAFQQTGSRLTLVPQNVMCADALVLLGHDAEAVPLLDQAEAEAEARHEQLYAPEIHRVRALIALRRGDQAGAVPLLRRAIAIAQQQQARLLELRAALMLHELLPAGSDRDLLAARIREVVIPFPSTRREPEIVQARALVLS